VGSQLKGKNALVTGGGSGIGLASAGAFVRDGANVLIMGRNGDKLEAARRTLAEINPDVTVSVHVGDVGVEADVKSAVVVASIDGHPGRL
jgi:NAD(P)-dependent dehydrogenase (short-subunit alcohol dehydrogenase family)